MVEKEKTIDFSVIIPCYNVEKTIDFCIKSVLEQTYPPLEIIVVDNGSNDGTQSKLVSLKHDSVPIKIIYEKKRGISNALNKGISVASSSFVARMDADDIAREKWLENAAKFIRKHGNCKIFSFNYAKFNCNPRKVIEIVEHPKLQRQLYPLLLFCSPLAHPGAIISIDVARNLKYRDIPAEDHDLFCRYARNGELGNVGYVAMFYRVSAGSLSARKKFRYQFFTIINGILFFLSNPQRYLYFFCRLKVSELSCFTTLPLNKIVRLQRICKLFSKIGES